MTEKTEKTVTRRRIHTWLAATAIAVGIPVIVAVLIWGIGEQHWGMSHYKPSPWCNGSTIQPYDCKYAGLHIHHHKRVSLIEMPGEILDFWLYR